MSEKFITLAAPTQRVIVQLLPILVIVYLMIALFPSVHSTNGPGLDRSWIYALNHFPLSRYAFGEDVFFTYGPLGYLLYPLPGGNTFTRTILFRLVIHLLLGVLLVLHWRVTGNRRGVLIFIASYLLLNTLSPVVEAFSDYYLMMVCGLALSLGLKREKWLPFSLATCVFFSNLLIFTKFNTGIAATALFYTAVVLIFIRNPERWKLALTALAIHLITFLTLSAVLISPGRLAMWLRTSFEISSEFSAAMSLQGARFGLLKCVVSFAVYLLLTAWMLLKKRPAGLVGLSFLPVMLIAFKSGFVRQDGHEMNFFFALSLVMCMMGVCVERFNELLAATIAFLIVFAATADTRLKWWTQDDWKARTLSILSLDTGLAQIDRLINLKQREQWLAEVSQRNLAPLLLPNDWMDKVDRKHQTFDVVPWEINYCPANDLMWTPRPILQSYSAYTAWLDDLDAKHFRDGNAPDFVLVNFASIDDRHMLWDTPATWRMLLNNYEVDRVKAEANLLMLKKKALPSEPTWQTIGETIIAPQQWQAPPDSQGLLFAQMNLSLTPSGQFRKIAFRLPPVMIEIENADGQQTAYRVMPAVARNGLLLNNLPRNLEELARLFRCQATSPVRRFRLTGRGADFLAQTINVNWKKAITPCGAISKPTY